MITLVCAQCGKGVELDSSLFAGELTCPHCGTPLPAPSLPAIVTDPPQGRLAPSASSDTPHTHLSLTSPDLPPDKAFSFLAPPRRPDEIGRLGTYRVLRVLGQGGMGVVFQAEDTCLERLVALKVIRPEAARDPAARQRFLREARLTASVRSDNIVTIHQVGEIDGVLFLAMELLPGESLATWLARGQRPTGAQLLDLALQVARGLDVAHRAGLVHRDIKPANLWLEGEPGAAATGGRVKVLDLGLARPAGDNTTLTQVGMVVGTPAYMAPEQAEGKGTDARSDLFSLGCVLYESATGQAPFAGATPFAIMKALALVDPRSPSTINPAIPAPLGLLVLRLLQKKPSDRPGSAAEVIADLERLGASLGLRPDSGPHAAAGPWQVRRPGTGWLVAGLAGLALCTVVAFHVVPRLGSLFSPKASTVRGVSDDEVLFGITGPFSGPVVELGRRMETGIQTGFAEVNDQGGVAGRKLRLVALDDEHDPQRALDNVKELVEQRRVFALVGNVGTTTTERALPYLLDHKRLLFGACTGASALRKAPPDRYVFNYRPGVEEETSAVVHYLLDVKNVRPEQIAVFDQQDHYGESGFQGVARVLRQRHQRPPGQVLRVRYPRNTLDVDEAARQIVAHKEVRAVVMVPLYRSAALFIKKVKDARQDVLFTCTSFVNSVTLGEELLQFGPNYPDGVIVTLATPPLQSRSSLVLKYTQQLRQTFPSERPDPMSLEGYIVAVLLTEGLRRTGRDLSTETLIENLESIRDFDPGLGTPLRFSPSDHQASHRVWAVRLDRQGKPQPLEDWRWRE
jgi:ABC-type branched-subunit amino acid transport system substrate-binding protein/tRNA A-37 threonylcarbamoyl transferase component Bud32